MRIKGHIFSYIISAFVLMFAVSAFADNVNLYAEPNDKAKVIGTIDVTAGIVPIFTSSDGAWMKVGNSKTGDVGWVKSSDMKSGPVIPTLFNYTNKVINDGNANNAPQFIQFNSGPTLTPDQQNQLIQGQQQIQRNLQNGAQEIMNGMQNIFQWRTNPTPPAAAPLPIVIFPVKQTGAPAQQTTNPTGAGISK